MTNQSRESPRLDVIIPVKDRTTVRDCLAQLYAAAERAESFALGQILLCDGDSQTTACREQLAEVAQWDKVELLSCLSPVFTGGVNKGFNKGWLLNQGLAATTASLILISDVDILWNRETLEELAIAATHQPNNLCYVGSVRESKLGNPAPQRPRYGYRLEQQDQGYLVEIFASPSAPKTASSPLALRPGCGLVCAQRSLFQQVGGYRHCFWGWGWEDQDLLIRAQLLGYGLTPLGWAIHLSHGDEQRNAFSAKQSVQKSRDLNILRCLAELSPNNLQGDWSLEEPRQQPQLNFEVIHTQLPAALQGLANAQNHNAP